MTLIAAFKLRNVPVLIGDFLITAKGQVAGAKKKVHLISPNLVVAWTGHLLAAGVVLSDIYNQFHGRKVSRNELRKFLTYYSSDKKLGTLAVTLMGWIVTDHAHCFVWQSNYPKLVHYKDHDSNGSGEATFERLFGEEVVTDGQATRLDVEASSTLKNRINAATGFSFKVVTELLQDERLARENQAQGFGLGYEILYFDGRKFQYVDNIIYASCVIQIDVSKRHNEVELLQPVQYYHVVEDCAVFRISENTSKNYAIHLISPAYTSSNTERTIKKFREAFERSSNFPIQLEAEYLALGVYMRDTERDYQFPFLTFPLKLRGEGSVKKDAPIQVDSTQNGWMMRIHDKLIWTLYETMAQKTPGFILEQNLRGDKDL